MSVAAYRDHLTGRYPITLLEIRDGFNGAFGDEPPAEVLDAAGVDPVEAVAAPAFDPAMQTLAEGAPERKNGKWRQTWTVSALPAPAVPNEIADWQFATILAEDQIITQAEAEDFAGAGAIPAAMEKAINEIDDETLRRRIRIKVRGAKTYVRTDAATVMLAELLGYQGAAVDDIWRRGALVV